MVQEPEPPCPDWPRYTTIKFPAYRFVPGLNPHPRNHPDGHSYRKAVETPGPWQASAWRTLTPYLFGVDLFNYAYWWECHETLEGLWLSAGRTTFRARFVQGLIQIAAANLHWHRGNRLSARSMMQKGSERLEFAAGQAESYMGIQVPSFVEEVRAYFGEKVTSPVLIRLGD